MRKYIDLRRVTVWLWGIVALDIVIIFVVAGWQFSSLGLLLALAAWLLLSMGGAAIGLTFCYRRYFAHWWTWLALLALWVAGALVVHEDIKIPQAALSFLLTMLFFCGGLSLLIALCLRLYQRDFGISLIGWMTVICIWSIVIMWRVYGDLIEAMFQSAERPSQPSPVWWSSLLLSSACCLVPVALLSVVWHTIVLLRRDRRGEAPPASVG